jgi:hypothetical protein
MPEGTQDNQRPNETPGADDNRVNEDVVLTDDEQGTLEEGTKNKVETMSFQKKHWRDKAKAEKEAREKAELRAKELEEENRKLKGTPTEQKPPEQKPAAQPAQPDVNTAVKQTLIDTEKKRLLKALPEDKRADVEKSFSKLTAGEQFELDDVENYVVMAARAVGVEMPRSSTAHRVISAGNGTPPPKGKPSLTKEQQEIALKSGNDPAKVEKADFSHMIGGDKILNGSED